MSFAALRKTNDLLTNRLPKKSCSTTCWASDSPDLNNRKILCPICARTIPP
jgi:hypothetical protein